MLTMKWMLEIFPHFCSWKVDWETTWHRIKVNDSTYLNCSTDYGSTAIFWFHGNKFVYTGTVILQPYHERFVIDRNVFNGTYIFNLVIHSVHPDDAGKYTCEEDEGAGEKSSAQLVVLGEHQYTRLCLIKTRNNTGLKMKRLNTWA